MVIFKLIFVFIDNLNLVVIFTAILWIAAFVSFVVLMNLLKNMATSS